MSENYVRLPTHHPGYVEPYAGFSKVAAPPLRLGSSYWSPEYQAYYNERGWVTNPLPTPVPVPRDPMEPYSGLRTADLITILGWSVIATVAVGWAASAGHLVAGVWLFVAFCVTVAVLEIRLRQKYPLVLVAINTISIGLLIKHIRRLR